MKWSRVAEILVPSFFKKEEKPLDALEEVCVFPLPNIVLFPGTMIPLHIYEEKYRIMTDDILAKRFHLAMSLGKPSPDGHFVPSSICGAGPINVTQAFPDGRKDIFVEGRKRLKIVKIIQNQPYIRALAEVIPDIPFDDPASEDKEHQELSLLVRRWIFLSPDLSDQYLQYVSLFSKPHQLADFLAAYFLPHVDQKQKYLENRDRRERVKMVSSLLSQKISFLQKETVQQLSDFKPAITQCH